MAMHDSWGLIQRYGLLPTNELLSLFQIAEDRRAELTSKRRPTSVDIEHPELGVARIRDQLPLLDDQLARCLDGGLTPLDWHNRLNERVFFWVTRERLQRLMCAGAYRRQSHLVLEVPTRPIFENYEPSIELSPMNSGCTRPFPHPRGPDTFLPIESYPYAERSAKTRGKEPVVEVTVLGGIPDIAEYVTRATISSCRAAAEVVFER